MKHLHLIILVLAVMLSTTIPCSVVGEERTILVVRKEVRFNITVVVGPGDNGTVRTVILVLDFYFINAEPSNSDVNISFPVAIRVGDKVINKTVIVPLRVRGELEKIVVVSAREAGPPNNGGSGGEEIIVYSPSTGPAAVNITFPEQRTGSPAKPSGAVALRTVTKTITTTKTITMGAVGAPSQQGAIASTSQGPRGSTGNTGTGPDYTIILLGIVIAVIATLLAVLARHRPETPATDTQKAGPPQMSQPSTPTTQAILGEPRPRIPRLKCPVCGEIAEPIITDDNKIVCPACHNEIGRIKEDGSLELLEKNNNKKEAK